MKRILLILAAAAGLSLAASARGNYAHDASVLPEAARTVIANNCKAKVSLVKVEKTMGRIDEYEVILTDGTEITFDRNGNWENVETARNKQVPDAFLPKSIKTYVARNHKGTKIVGIEKERNGFEVELSNGIDMKFDKNGEFLRYDK
ncbi:MAG: PepSY-like domain-containing protein [Muribaculaceae bacterium]|nr:PepSY-like domain-containing protein [Muribaculaceae bacterium]